MILAVLSLLAAMTSADAVAVLLNSKSAVRARTFEEARAIVEREAREGKPLQQFVVSVTTDDKELARKCREASYEKIRLLAEQKDNPLAWYLLAMEKNDLKMLKRAADGGNVQAMNALGTIITEAAFSRKGISKEDLDRYLTQSFGYFKKAAALRDPNGFINLGSCYLRGLGCKPDMAMAFSCFKAAAEMGHPEGMDNISACYQFGHGVTKDGEMSLYWAMRGRAARGDEAAEKWLRDRK